MTTEDLPENRLPDWLDNIVFMLIAMAFAGSMALLAFWSVGEGFTARQGGSTPGIVRSP